MACPLSNEEINKLKFFISYCARDPSMLNLPQLDFFKSFVEQLGGKVPATEPPKPSAKAQAKAEAKASGNASTVDDPVVDSEESDVELDNEGVVEPDTDAPQEMGDSSKEPSEEEMDTAGDHRSKAAGAYSEQKYEDALKSYTDAIQVNPKNSLFYAKRGQVFLKLVKPNACIRDCNRALELNPDSAAAYKFRGRAQRLLGNWEESAKDLRQACKLDYDEEADEWLKEVSPNAKKLVQHKIKWDRKKAERELRDKRERVRKAQEANKKAAEENKRDEEDDQGDFMGKMGPDIMGAFSDPEVAAALQDVMTNPANIMKYQNNPKVMGLLSKLGGAGGGGFPGFGGGFPGFADPSSGNASNADAEMKSTPKADFHDDGLD